MKKIVFLLSSIFLPLCLTPALASREEIIEATLLRFEIAQSFDIGSEALSANANNEEKSDYKQYYKDIKKTEDSRIENESNILEKKFEFLWGYRQDKLDWNIAGNINGENPNILSELTWKDLQIFQIKTTAKFIYNKTWRLEGSYGYGWIYRGKNQDSDFLGNNRTLEFSRSNNNAEGDNVSDWSAGLGYQFNLYNNAALLCDEGALAFLGGYSLHEQNLRITDGFQTIPATGSFGGLNSTYQAEWKGPWVGVELEGTKGKGMGFLRFEYHWADYFAEADWNLRTDLAHPVSFSHDASGRGIIASFGTGYNIKDNLLIYLKADVLDWKTGKGIDRTFAANGSTSDTRLNRVNWKSFAAMLGFRYQL